MCNNNTITLSLYRFFFKSSKNFSTALNSCNNPQEENIFLVIFEKTTEALGYLKSTKGKQ